MTHRGSLAIRTYRNVNRVSVETEGLAVRVVVSGEGVLHILQCSSVVDLALAVGSVEPWVHEMDTVNATVVEHRVHGHLPEAGQLGLTLAGILEGKAVVGETVIKRVWSERIGVALSDRKRGGR